MKNRNLKHEIPAFAEAASRRQAKYETTRDWLKWEFLKIKMRDILKNLAICNTLAL